MGLFDWLEDVAESGEVVFDIAQNVPLWWARKTYDVATDFPTTPMDIARRIAGVVVPTTAEQYPDATPEMIAAIDQAKVDLAAKLAADVEYQHALAVAKARGQLNKFLLAGGLIVGVPIAYAAAVAATRKKGAAITPQQEMIGRSLENASSQATGVAITALASPVIAAAATYVLIQKLEDAEYISKGLGNAAQTLLTVAAAGPAIQGIGQVAGSAFKAITKVK